MSSPHSHFPPLTVRERETCMCIHGANCSSYAPGHGLHLIQARLVSATPSEWVDAIVEQTDAATGDILVRMIDNGSAVTLWNGAGAAAAVSVGTPVALHSRYHVLAIGAVRFNVLTD